MTLNGMFSEPKPHRINFIKENKKKLKHISSTVGQNEKSKKIDLTKSQSSEVNISKPSSSIKLNAHTNSSRRLNRKSTITVFMSEKRPNDRSSSTALFPPYKSSHRSLNCAKDQSCQTIDPNNYDQLFFEGTILYPSSKVLEQIAEAEKQKANRLDAHVKKEFFKKNKIKSKSLSKTVIKAKEEQLETRKEVDENLKKETDEYNKKEVKETTKSDEENKNLPKTKESDSKIKPKRKDSIPALNAADIIRRTTEDQLNYSPRNYQQNPISNQSVPSNRGDSSPSNIPKISKKPIIKKKAEDEVLKTVLDPMCPPGHIPLPDQERKKTLHMLRVSYAELIREMNLLPVRTDTLRIRQRKIQLENQLNKIEEGIKVFNKSKVYVKIEE